MAVAYPSRINGGSGCRQRSGARAAARRSAVGVVVTALLQNTYGEEKASAVLDDQVRGVYRLYRTFGGDDMDANRPSRDYRNTFQYAPSSAPKAR